jgi:hypothetical protein
VIINVQPRELGIPTKAYYAVEEVKEVNGYDLSAGILHFDPVLMESVTYNLRIS